MTHLVDKYKSLSHVKTVEMAAILAVSVSRARQILQEGRLEYECVEHTNTFIVPVFDVVFFLSETQKEITESIMRGGASHRNALGYTKIIDAGYQPKALTGMLRRGLIDFQAKMPTGRGRLSYYGLQCAYHNGLFAKINNDDSGISVNFGYEAFACSRLEKEDIGLFCDRVSTWHDEKVRLYNDAYNYAMDHYLLKDYIWKRAPNLDE